jgi:HSP20 family molecular chaperone IbpA
MALLRRLACGLQPRVAWRSVMHTRADVFERERNLVLEIEVPGVSPGALQVTIEAACVVVIIDEAADRCGRWHRCERAHGVRARQIPLPFAIDPRQTQIGIARGLLTIRAPFATAASGAGQRWTAARGIVPVEAIGTSAVEPTGWLGHCSR